MYADESVYPSIVPQPILVGQYVTAIHPIYKTICNGTVLTSDTYNGNYQIQFDNAKYGVHLCNITDIIVYIFMFLCFYIFICIDISKY